MAGIPLLALAGRRLIHEGGPELRRDGVDADEQGDEITDGLSPYVQIVERTSRIPHERPPGSPGYLLPEFPNKEANEGKQGDELTGSLSRQTQRDTHARRQSG
jgi:hypothetical protein